MSLASKIGYIPRLGYWACCSSKLKNIYNIGININTLPSTLYEEYIYNISFYFKYQGLSIPNYQYMGTILNNDLQALHFENPFPGKILSYNIQLLYSNTKISDLIHKENWLFTMELDNDIIEKKIEKKNKYLLK